MTNKLGLAVASVGFLVFVGAAEASEPPNMSASFHDMSDTQFSITALSPTDRIREYVICKAVWFAEKNSAQSMSLDNPVYSEPPKSPEGPWEQVPEDWLQVSTTAYLDDAVNPRGNPKVSVAEYARMCRQMWGWYH